MILLGLPLSVFLCFLPIISKNFDDFPISFENFCWSYLRSGFVSKTSYQFRLFICSAFAAFLETGRKGNRDFIISKSLLNLISICSYKAVCNQMCCGPRRTGCFAMIWRVSLRFVFRLLPCSFQKRDAKVAEFFITANF